MLTWRENGVKLGDCLQIIKCCLIGDNNNMCEKNYEYGIVTYFDLLGFSNLIKTNAKSPSEIYALLKFMQEEAGAEPILKMGTQNGIAFSDSFVRVVKRGTASDLRNLLSQEYSSIQIIQQKIIRNFKIPVRGAMTIGLIFIENGVVFGPALVRAVELEKTATKRMPIIILDHCVTDIMKTKNPPADFSICDCSYTNENGLPTEFVDYFDTLRAISCKDFLCTKDEDILSLKNRRDLSLLTEHKQFILESFNRSTNDDIKNKYRFLALYHNQKINQINNLINLREGINVSADYIIDNLEIDGCGLRPFSHIMLDSMATSCFVNSIKLGDTGIDLNKVDTDSNTFLRFLKECDTADIDKTMREDLSEMTKIKQMLDDIPKIDAALSEKVESAAQSLDTLCKQMNTMIEK
jgi:hypothetical protein